MNKLMPYYELVQYDGPQVFLAKDEVGTKHLCARLKEDGKGLFFLAMAISDDRLSSLLNGSIDLRETFIRSEKKEWFIVNDADDGLTFVHELTELDPQILPDHGFYFRKDEFKNFEILSESTALGKTVVHLSLSEGDSDDHTIDSEALADVLKLYQAVLKHLLKKAASKGYIHKDFVVPANYKLRAAAYSPSSFKLHLVSMSNSELFGKNVIDQVLTRVDTLNDGNTEENNVIGNFKPYAGHTVSAYKNLLSKLIDKNITMKVVWASPVEAVAHETRITPSHATQVKDILLARKDLDTEVREFVGLVEEADIVRRTWRIRNNEDNKPYKGTSNIGLEGVVLNGTYKFICQEVTEELAVSDTDRTTYVLTSFEPLKS